jgi:hypothetical protein
MATDSKARRITITYDGGSLTASRGLLESIFGPALVASAGSQPLLVLRESHTRSEYPGGPRTAVSGSTFTLKRYGKPNSGGPSGGEPILLYVGGAPFTARLSGSHQAFCDYLKNSTWQSGNDAFWRSQHGTPYGPFRGDEPTP